MKPRVLMDVDEVIADFTGYYLKLAEKVMHTPYRREQVIKWDIGKCLDLPAWATREITYELRRPDTALKLDTLPGSVEAVKQLAEISEIYFVTSPYWGSLTWASDREAWLVHHFGDLGERVIHTKFKAPISGDFLLDDKPENILDWGLAQDGVPILWNQIHNRGFNEKKESIPILRYDSWEKVIGLVKTVV